MVYTERHANRNWCKCDTDEAEDVMEGMSNGVLYESKDRKLPLGGWNLPEAKLCSKRWDTLYFPFYNYIKLYIVLYKIMVYFSVARLLLSNHFLCVPGYEPHWETWFFFSPSVNLSSKEIISVQLKNFKIIRMEVLIIFKKSNLGLIYLLLYVDFHQISLYLYMLKMNLNLGPWSSLRSGNLHKQWPLGPALSLLLWTMRSAQRVRGNKFCDIYVILLHTHCIWFKRIQPFLFLEL